MSRPTCRTKCRVTWRLGSPPGAGALAIRLGARLALPSCLPGFGRVLLGLASILPFTLGVFSSVSYLLTLLYVCMHVGCAALVHLCPLRAPPVSSTYIYIVSCCCVYIYIYSSICIVGSLVIDKTARRCFTSWVPTSRFEQSNRELLVL